MSIGWKRNLLWARACLQPLGQQEAALWQVSYSQRPYVYSWRMNTIVGRRLGTRNVRRANLRGRGPWVSRCSRQVRCRGARGEAVGQKLRDAAFCWESHRTAFTRLGQGCRWLKDCVLYSPDWGRAQTSRVPHTHTGEQRVSWWNLHKPFLPSQSL